MAPTVESRRQPLWLFCFLLVLLFPRLTCSCDALLDSIISYDRLTLLALRTSVGISQHLTPEFSQAFGRLFEEVPAFLITAYGLAGRRWKRRRRGKRGGTRARLRASRILSRNNSPGSQHEICTFLSQGATQAWDSAQNVPYAYNGNLWVGYDNEKSFKIKANWLMQNNFGGAMVWTLDLDDFSGTFCNQGRYPLINTLKRTLGVNTSGCTAPANPITRAPNPPAGGRSGSRGSSSGSGGSSSGGSGFCAGKANGLYPNSSNKNRFWNCLNGVTYSENCAAGLVFDANCSCCNWA